MKVWRLSKGSDRRFRQGHPWVYASEVGHSIKEIQAGDLIELRDASDHFLAYGYGHPGAQICFRRLSSRSQDRNVLSVGYFIERLKAARDLRLRAGWAECSHRWIYAESDGVPGLIVDAFKNPHAGWMIVVQASTAGIERALPNLFEALQSFASELGEVSIIEAPSSKSRVSEGLSVGGKRQVSGRAVHLEQVHIQLQYGLQLQCDLLHGQKTGFFLDQQWNAGLLRRLLPTHFKGATQTIRVLDICCYVGQWSGHIVQALHEAGVRAEVTLVDSSESALALAKINLEALGAEVTSVCGDALSAVGELPAGHFDVVVCDPPAFVKKRADLPQGLKAYAKLNRDAMRATAAAGLYVASSCSGSVRGDDWREVMVQASQKASRTYKLLLKGGHGPDHPVRPEFPEGEYLKCEIGRVDFPY